MGTKIDLLYRGLGNMVTKRPRCRIEHVVWELVCRPDDLVITYP